MLTRMLMSLVRLTLFLSVSLLAYAEAKPPEDQLPEFYQSTIKPFFETQGSTLTFTGEKNIQLNAYRFLGGPRAVVIVPGWGEPARKYAEVAYDLFEAGFSVYIIDHRGQGESERILDCQCSYVEDYEYYAKDLVRFINSFVKPDGFEKVFILAHSMGGGITAETLAKNPGLVDGAVLSSPMLHIVTDPYAEAVAQSLTRTMVLIGKGKERRLFDKDKPDVFEGNIVTHSEVRWKLSRQLLAEMPQLRVGWATNRWLNEMFEMTNSIRKQKDITTPILMLQSETDKYVVNDTLTKLCTKWSRCKAYRVPGTLHEILMEKDAARNSALGVIKTFFKSH